MLFLGPTPLPSIQARTVSEKLDELFPPEICRMIIELVDDDHEKMRYEIYITARYRDAMITNAAIAAHVNRTMAAWAVRDADVATRASDAMDLVNYLFANLRSKRINQAMFAAFKKALVVKAKELSSDDDMLVYYPREIKLLTSLVVANM